MLGKLVAVHLFRLEHALRLRRIPSTSEVVASRWNAPAILMIPREGPLREPHLMVFSQSEHHRGMPPGEQVFGGTHVVVDLDGPMNQDWCEIADVIVGPRRSQIAPAPVASLVLDRYPGCEVVVGRRERDCLAGMRDGRLAAITEVGEFSDRAVSWLAIYGSFLYSWRVARMPFEGLATASVIAGRYLGSSSDRLGSLEVAGRAQIMLAHRWPRDAGGTST